MEQTQTPPVAPPPAAQPAASGTPEAPPEQPKYVTEEMLAEAVEKGFRRAQQSAADRTRTIESKVAELTKQMQGLGVQVTPEIQARMQEQVAQEVDAPPAPAPAPAATAEPGEGNPVYDWTMAYYSAAGLGIEQADPEWAAIQAALSDPAGNMTKYQATVAQAVEKKRARVTNATATADARVVGTGAHSGTPAGSAKELWERAHK